MPVPFRIALWQGTSPAGDIADALATAATARQRAERSLAVLEAAVQRPFRLLDADVSVKPASPSKKK